MPLADSETRTIKSRIADIEARTGVRITTSVIARADSYVELPWKAFALGVALAAFAVVLADAFAPPQWGTPAAALKQATIVLGAGAVSALAAMWVPAWARLFLRPSRRDVEVRQHAQALFLTRELFATPRRTGVLILVSRFERKIELLPDIGLHDAVSRAEWRGVIAQMTPAMRDGHPFHAMQAGLAAAEELLVRKGFTSSAPASDAVIE